VVELSDRTLGRIRAWPRVPAVLLVAGTVVWTLAGLTEANWTEAPASATVAIHAIGILAALAVAAGAAARPELAAWPVLAIAPFHAAVTVPAGPRSLGVLEAVTLAVLAGAGWSWALRAGRRPAPTGRGHWRTRWLDVAVAVLVLWSSLAVMWAEATAPAFREWRLVLLEPALVYALLRSQPRRREAITYAFDGLVVGALAACAVAGVAATAAVLGLGSDGSTGLVAAEGVTRLAGPYGSPNNLALFVGRAAAVAAAMTIWGSGSRRRLHVAALVILMVGLGATFSRGALFVGLPLTGGVLLVCAVVPLLRRRPRKASRASRLAAARISLAVFLVGLAAVAVLTLAFAGTERIRSTLSAEPGSTLHLRIRLWSAAVEMGRDHAFLGVGPDNFLPHYRDFYVKRDAVTERHLNHPHNFALDAWLRLGVPGALVLGIIALYALRAAVRRVVSEAHAPDPIPAASLGLLAYALAHGLVDNFYFVPDLAMAWWVAVAASQPD
jgi:O-antigen ligase